MGVQTSEARAWLRSARCLYQPPPPPPPDDPPLLDPSLPPPELLALGADTPAAIPAAAAAHIAPPPAPPDRPPPPVHALSVDVASGEAFEPDQELVLLSPVDDRAAARALRV